jgi:glycosyltransferase involved in cell wall biosynthesis
VPPETLSGSAECTRSRPAGRAPRVSIGLPVHNGARYLEAALDSLLAQTFTDFELIISDNASTDETPAICRAYAARDGRIRYSRLNRNTGGLANHNRVVELAVGEYFTWGSHDDLRAPEHLARCVEELDRDPEVVLCFSRVREIDELGAVLPDPREREFLANVDSHDPSTRWREMVSGHWVYDPIYGAIRRDVLGRTDLLRLYADSDRVLLGELALYGRFRRIEEALFFRRIHSGQSTRVFPSRRARVAWYAPDRVGQIAFPLLRQCREWCRVLGRVPLPWPVRLRCVRAVAAWALYWRHVMFGELTFATRVIAQRAVRRWPRLRQQAAP